MLKFAAFAALVAIVHGGTLLSAPIAAPVVHYTAAAPVVTSSAITTRADSYAPVVAPIAHYAATPVVASSAITARIDGYTVAHSPIAHYAVPVASPL